MTNSNTDMKTIRLQKIKSKCEYLIQSSLENSHGPRTETSIAAWKSTIAAIDYINQVDWQDSILCDSIISAWPEELL